MSHPHKNLNATQAIVHVTGASGCVFWLVVENRHATDTVYLKLYGESDASVGTTVPDLTIPCPPGVSGYSFGDGGVELENDGVHYAVTATSADNNAGAPPATVTVNMGFG